LIRVRDQWITFKFSDLESLELPLIAENSNPESPFPKKEDILDLNVGIGKYKGGIEMWETPIYGYLNINNEKIPIRSNTSDSILQMWLSKLGNDLPEFHTKQSHIRPALFECMNNGGCFGWEFVKVKPSTCFDVFRLDGRENSPAHVMGNEHEEDHEYAEYVDDMFGRTMCPAGSLGSSFEQRLYYADKEDRPDQIMLRHALSLVGDFERFEQHAETRMKEAIARLTEEWESREDG